LLQVRFVVAQRFGDWSAFWAAGATAGTADLLDPHRHAVWQTQHHLLTTIFPYLPGAAWLLRPLREAPLAAGYAINFVVMAIAAAAAAAVAARVYGIARDLAVLYAFAWAPVIAALATGQNAPAGLAFVMLAIAGFTANSWLVCGLAVGVLLYKLPYALPFIVLLAVRRDVRALAVIAACGIVWFFASVAATGGDWHWPAHYADALRGYAGADAHFNAVKAISIAHLLMRAGIAQSIATLCGALLFVAALPLLIRTERLEAASFAPLLGLAALPHTLPYDLTLMLPALYFLMTHLREPVRTRAICSLYLVAPLWLLSGVLRFDVLALVCEGVCLVWVVKGWYESTSRTYLGIADSRNRGEA
jgi:hypothetical protein